MTGDIAVKVLGGDISNPINTVHLQIDHSSAVIADKVIMWAGVGIEVIDSVT
jgi:hypothetical protein